MGYKLTNIQVRTDDDRRVVEVLEPLLGRSHAYVSPAEGGWVSVYPRSTERMDDAALRDLASRISGDLHCGAIAFLVFEVLAYWLFDDGTLLDSYDSAPGMFGPSSARAERETRGRPELLCAIATREASVSRLAEILRRVKPTPTMAAGALAELQGFARLQQVVQSAATPEARRAAMEDLRRQMRQKIEGMATTFGPYVAGPETRLSDLATELGIPSKLAILGYDSLEAGETDEPRAVFTLLPRGAAASRKREKRARAARISSTLHANESIRFIHEVPEQTVLQGVDADRRIWCAVGAGRFPGGKGRYLALDGDSGRSVLDVEGIGMLWTAMSNDGRLFAHMEGTWDGKVVLRRTSDFAEVARLPGTPRGIGSLWFYPDDSRLAVSSDGILRVLDVATGAVLHERLAIAIAGISSDGKRVAIGDQGFIQIADATTFAPLERIGVPPVSHLYGMAFSPDGAHLFVGTCGKGVMVLDLEEGRVRETLTWKSEGKARVEIFRRMAARLAKRGLRGTGQEMESRSPEAECVALKPLVQAEGEWLAALGGDGYLRLWGLPSLVPMAAHDTGDAEGQACLGRDGTHVVTCSGGRVISWRAQGCSWRAQGCQ